MKKIIILCLFSAGIACAMNFEQTQKMLTNAIKNDCITPGETDNIINAVHNISPQDLETLIQLTNNKLAELYGRRDKLKGKTSLPQFLLMHNNTQIKLYYDILTNLVVH